MSETISKASVCEILADIYPTDGEKVVAVKEVDKAYEAIQQLPHEDVQPVVHGEWITKSTNGEMFDSCSVCGYVEWDEPKNYCPNCGAKMDGKGADNG